MVDLILFRAALKDLLRRRIAVAALLAALPALATLVWRISAQGRRGFSPETAYNVLAGDFIFGFVLVILAVVFGTGIITQETEGRTIVYLLTRPVPRWRILLARYMAACVAVLLTVWVSTGLLAVTAYGGVKALSLERFGRDLTILPVGVVAYVALFLCLATFLRRPLLLGLLFAFGWESWVPNFPGSFQMTSLMAYLRVLAPHVKPADDSIDLGALLSGGGGSVITHTLAVRVLAGVTAAALLLSLLLFTEREYTPREDAE